MVPLKDGDRVLGFLKILRDQTAVRSAHEALQTVELIRDEARRANDAQFQDLAESIPQLTWVADAVGEQVWFNRRWHEYTGVPTADLQHQGWMTFAHPDHADRVVRGLLNSLSLVQSWEDTYLLRAVDGTYRWFLARAVPIMGLDGAVQRWFGTHTDINDRYETGEQSERDASSLSGRLDSQTERLHNSEAFLKASNTGRQSAEHQVRQLQKMEAVGQLTGGIAHDFNNMLAVIISGLNLLQRRLARGDTNVQHYVDAAMDAANRAAQLTQGLLAFSRQLPLAPSSLNVNDLVAEMSEMIRRTIGEESKLETVLAGGLWRTHADASQLENSLLNLAVNARDAMPDGGRITIETANTHLDDVYAYQHDIAAGQYVMMAVTDTGTGMTRDVLDKAFEPFFTTKPVGKGTGLGLSQVFGFVKQSQGHIQIYSELGVGTSIKLYMPRYFGTDVAPLPKPIARPVSAAKVNELILVVEDEDRVRMMTVDSLLELGYSVIHANGGEAALALLKIHPEVSMLFTDIVMFGMSGRQLADEALETMPHLKVLYTTGYTRNAIVHNGVLDHGVNFLQKPFTLEQLAAKIREVLDH
jgi:PAS domain S-box-containing protein